MRKLIITLSLLLLPLMGGAALAASDSGTVRFVDTRTGMLQLADGASYYVPNRLPLSRLKKGDTVRIQFENRTGGPVVSKIVRTGSSDRAVPVITPARDARRVNKNFGIDNGMCKVTATSNPCYIGAQ
ncbi:DUF1344 domain-containing protein [Taklimakanibacter lacteus]|uniref:DUF1344 domain-containing protein n=1 Tax=Taklimakanibacter lacteus TaxID=2268456 RepID=UPI0013C426B4